MHGDQNLFCCSGDEKWMKLRDSDLRREKIREERWTSWLLTRFLADSVEWLVIPFIKN